MPFFHQRITPLQSMLPVPTPISWLTKTTWSSNFYYGIKFAEKAKWLGGEFLVYNHYLPGLFFIILVSGIDIVGAVVVLKIISDVGVLLVSRINPVVAVVICEGFFDVLILGRLLWCWHSWRILPIFASLTLASSRLLPVVSSFVLLALWTSIISSMKVWNFF